MQFLTQEYFHMPQLKHSSSTLDLGNKFNTANDIICYSLRSQEIQVSYK